MQHLWKIDIHRPTEVVGKFLGESPKKNFRTNETKDGLYEDVKE